MKNNKLVSLGALFCGIASFISCSSEVIASANRSNLEVSNKSLVADEHFFKNINFEGVFAGLEILKDFSVPITEKEGVKEIISKEVGKVLSNFFDGKVKGIRSISYRIVHDGDKVSFTNLKVVEADSDEEQGGYSDCPDGLSHIKTCFSRDCVQETLGELEQYFSSGDTIYIHHDVLGGVIIYSDVKMR